MASDPPIVPGWTLTELVGAGDFANVWLGESLEDGGRGAIKVLHPEHVGIFSFLQESEALWEIRHPGVVAILAKGQHHFAMDYVEGRELTYDLQAGKRWSMAETVSILGPLCDALGAVHRAGFVHCDVNPGNIMLTASSPVLIDFGWVTLPRLRSSRKLHSRWCSPEAIWREPASVLDDLWPIPLLAELMLTGLCSVAGDPMDVWLSLRSYDGFEDPPAHPNLPTGFTRWYRKATHPDPSKRYQTASTLKQSLLRLAR